MQVAGLCEAGGGVVLSREALLLCGLGWRGPCREGTPRSQCAPLDGRQADRQAGRVSLGPTCRDVTLSILAPPPPPSKHPLSVEGTAQGFLRGHWLLNERPD